MELLWGITWKREADGAIGRLSMIIDTVVHSGTFEFGNCKELTAYCWQYLKMGDNSRGICCHYHRQYYEVSNILHVEDTDDIRTIRGTLGLHSVRNTGTPGVIKVMHLVVFVNHASLILLESAETKD